MIEPSATVGPISRRPSSPKEIEEELEVGPGQEAGPLRWRGQCRPGRTRDRHRPRTRFLGGEEVQDLEAGRVEAPLDGHENPRIEGLGERRILLGALLAGPAPRR